MKKKMINDLTDERTKSFATACYDQNSIADLQESLDYVDETDCREWGITADQWKEAIQTALNERLSENE